MRKRICRNKWRVRSKGRRSKNLKKRGQHIIMNSKKFKKPGIINIPRIRMIEFMYIFGGNWYKYKKIN